MASPPARNQEPSCRNLRTPAHLCTALTRCSGPLKEVGPCDQHGHHHVRNLPSLSPAFLSVSSLASPSMTRRFEIVIVYM